MAKVLFVVSGASYWTLADGTRHPTGYWAEEFAAPYAELHRRGSRHRGCHPRRRRPPTSTR